MVNWSKHKHIIQFYSWKILFCYFSAPQDVTIILTSRMIKKLSFLSFWEWEVYDSFFLSIGSCRSIIIIFDQAIFIFKCFLLWWVIFTFARITIIVWLVNDMQIYNKIFKIKNRFLFDSFMTCSTIFLCDYNCIIKNYIWNKIFVIILPGL